MAFYEPGQSYPIPKFLNQTDILGYPPSKRVLGSEEYEYYHSKLEAELPEPVKAGLAVVLLADLKRWFGMHSFTTEGLTDEFTSPLVMEYVQKFHSYDEGSSEKSRARAEIRKFDQYLMDSDPPGKTQEHITIQDARTAFSVRLAIAKKEKEKNMSVEEILALEKKEREQAKHIEEAKMQGLIIADAIENHMKVKIREYLAATYNNSTARLFMDKKNSDREFKLRLDLIKKVKSGRLTPIEAISRYKKILEDFSLLKNDIPLTAFSHPLASQVGG